MLCGAQNKTNSRFIWLEIGKVKALPEDYGARIITST
jgi:hypothetical protein